MERLDDPRERAALAPQGSGPKVEILPGAAPDGSECTFCIHNEDHTLGNSLRWAIMKNPDVEFCGYSAPHPSEPKIHLRVQMHDGKSAVDAVHKGIDALEVIFRTIDEKYKADVAEGDYDTTETKPLTLDDVRAMKTRPQAEKQEDATMS